MPRPKTNIKKMEGRNRHFPGLEAYKQEHITIARALGYSKEIQQAILDAESESAVTRAMIKGRHQMGDPIK